MRKQRVTEALSQKWWGNRCEGWCLFCDQRRAKLNSRVGETGVRTWVTRTHWNKTQTSPSCLCRLDSKRITHTGWHTLFIISFQTHTHTVLFFAACVVNGSVLGQKEQHDCRKRACVFHHLSLSGGRTWGRACVMERTAGFKTQETKK